MRMDAELACDQAHYYLVIKVQTRWHDLARVRRMFSLTKLAALMDFGTLFTVDLQTLHLFKNLQNRNFPLYREAVGGVFDV